MATVIQPITLKDLYVKPALSRLAVAGKGAEQLLMGTAAIESQFKYLKQYPSGPAHGYFQMETATLDWLFNDDLGAKRNSFYLDVVRSMTGGGSPIGIDLETNHLLAATMAWIKYRSHTHTTVPGDTAAQSRYWWVHYNGRSPHGLKPRDYLERWASYCASLYPPDTTAHA